MPDKTVLIKEYYRKVKAANKEFTKKEVFKDLLNRLYFQDKQILGLIDKITLGAEKTVLNIPRKDKIHKGSADTLYNHIIIEFENNLSLTINHAKEQLAGYLLGQLRKTVETVTRSAAFSVTHGLIRGLIRAEPQSQPFQRFITLNT